MRAAGQRKFEDTILLAHQIEAMARQKKLKPLGEYLKTKAPKRGTDAAVLTSLERAAAKGLVTIRERKD